MIRMCKFIITKLVTLINYYKKRNIFFTDGTKSEKQKFKKILNIVILHILKYFLLVTCTKKNNPIYFEFKICQSIIDYFIYLINL